MLGFQKNGKIMSCLCGNEKEYTACCGMIISGEKTASTPEELMRSRYCAYVLGDGTYLLNTIVKQNRDENYLKTIQEFTSSIEWLKLEIVHSFENIVEFKAYYRENNSIKLLHEKSTFIKEKDIWLYKEGELFNTKIQRNELCPCGSGKKYKKCCSK